MSQIPNITSKQFEKRFGTQPSAVAYAPGRVNLMGDHTDYNEGFVLPAAIDRGIAVALHAREDPKIRVYAADLGQEATFDIDDLARPAELPAQVSSKTSSEQGPAVSSDTPKWIDAVKAAVWVLGEKGHSISGADVVVGGDLPIGAGLSSSAAMEVALLFGFCGLQGINLAPDDAVQMAWRAENEYLGVKCGIMDQTIIVKGPPDAALRIDCRTQQCQAVPIPSDLAIAILDTGTRRTLGSSAYNERREECAAAARAMGRNALRDVTITDLEGAEERIDPVLLRRARHVVSENERVIRFAEALAAGDRTAIGDLMRASHKSLRDDFEVSSEALDRIVKIATGDPACIGARMTGAGFGGCAVALVGRAEGDAFAARVGDACQRAGLAEAKIYLCRASEGAALMPNNEGQ